MIRNVQLNFDLSPWQFCEDFEINEFFENFWIQVSFSIFRWKNQREKLPKSMEFVAPEIRFLVIFIKHSWCKSIFGQCIAPIPIVIRASTILNKKPQHKWNCFIFFSTEEDRILIAPLCWLDRKDCCHLSNKKVFFPTKKKQQQKARDGSFFIP